MSSSASSSSESGNRIRSAYLDTSAYKLISSSFPVEWNYEGPPVYCYCNMKAPRWCAWTSQNAGRRFYGCHNYPASDCGFHAWHDPIFTERSKEIISELRKRERLLFGNVRILKNELTRLRNNAVEELADEIIEENFLLKKKVTALRQQLKQAGEASVSSGRCVRVYISTVVLGCAFLVVLILYCFSSSKPPGKMAYALPKA